MIFYLLFHSDIFAGSASVLNVIENFRFYLAAKAHQFYLYVGDSR